MGLFDSMEDRIMEYMDGKLHMEHELDEVNLIYTTHTYLGEHHIHTHELDLSPLVDIITAKVKDGL